jgi:hypothetical protein
MFRRIPVFGNTNEMGGSKVDRRNMHSVEKAWSSIAWRIFIEEGSSTIQTLGKRARPSKLMC